MHRLSKRLSVRITTTVTLELFPKYKIVGERSGDNLPCYQCGVYGDIFIVQFEDEYRDICGRCLATRSE